MPVALKRMEFEDDTGSSRSCTHIRNHIFPLPLDSTVGPTGLWAFQEILFSSEKPILP